MSYDINRNFLYIAYKVIFFLFFITVMVAISYKAKYDNLESDYLQSASKVGKYYALSCLQKEKECRQLLQRVADSSAKTHWIERLYRDHLLQQRYNQAVLESFEEEIESRKNRGQATTQ